MAAETFDIELRLIHGGLMSPAKQAAAVLDSLETKAERVGSAFEDALRGKAKSGFDSAKKAAKGFSDDIQRAMQQASRLSADPKGFQMLAKARAQMAAQRKKLLEEAGLGKTPPGGGAGGGAGSGGSGSFGGGLAEGFGFGNLALATAWGELVGRGIIKGADFLLDTVKKVVGIFEDGIAGAFREGSKFEQLKLGYRISLRGQEGAESLADINRFSKETGYDDDAIARMLLPLRRAGFSREGARSAFAAATDIAAGRGEGGNVDLVQSLMEGFQHIMLKGGVQERRLPELGVNVKQFYGDLSKQLHITAEEAKKAAEEGTINPQLLLNTIYRGIERQQGGKLGTGGIEYGRTFEARFNKLKDLPNQYFKAVEESPKWNLISDKFGMLLDNLDPDSPRGKKIVDSLLNAFGKLGDVINKTFTAENVDRLTVGLEKVVKLGGALAEELGPVLDAALRLVDAYNTGDEINKAGGVDKYLNDNPSAYQQGETNFLGKPKDMSWSDWLSGMSIDQVKAYNASHMTNLSLPDKRSGADSGSTTSISVPTTINVNVGAGVDANNARQVGQQVGDSAGAAHAKHIGRVAQEAGAR